MAACNGGLRARGSWKACGVLMSSADIAPGNRASLPGQGHDKTATGFPDSRQPALATARSSHGKQGRVALCCAGGEGQRPVLACQCPQSPWPRAKPSLLGLWCSPLLFARGTHVALHSCRHGHTPAHTCTRTHAWGPRLQYRQTAAILIWVVWEDMFDRPESWDAPGIFWVKARMLLNFLHRTERPYHTEVFPP